MTLSDHPAVSTRSQPAGQRPGEDSAGRSSVHNSRGRPQATGSVVLRVVHDMWSGGRRCLVADLRGWRPCDTWDGNGTWVTTCVEVHPQLCTHLWVNVDDETF